MKMSDSDYKQIDFLQIEKHVNSAVSDLRRIQYAGKYSKKVCTPAMYGANMLDAQKNIISSTRCEVDRLEQENAELREALNVLVYKDSWGNYFTGLHGDTDVTEIVKQLLNK